jgi:hypothetical protein
MGLFVLTHNGLQYVNGVHHVKRHHCLHGMLLQPGHFMHVNQHLQIYVRPS